ncbi:MAG: sigma 54-interacting transcriptional regulator, partial [Bryobacterales bacterium]|nr:sigma 54-interacting transcriptional regulator [Bryobacterales bacterium]
MKARLRAIAGPQQGGTWTLGAETSIGRAPENDIILDDRSISRRQCQIVATPAGYRLRDGGGVNPTRVNGEVMGEAGLRHGDRLEMGRSLFEFVSEASEVTEIVDAGAEMDDAIEGEAAPSAVFDGSSMEGLAASVAAEACRRVAAARACLMAVSASRALEPLGTETQRLAMSVVRSALRAVSPVPARAKARAVAGDSLYAMRLSAAMAAPVLSDGCVIGVLYADKADGDFCADDLRTLTQLAAECAGPLAALVRASRVEQENRRLKAVLPEFGPMIGRSAGMQEVYRTLMRVAPTEATVLILGESGTGKELVARALHSHSGRAGGPFIAVNCAALPETLLESELF